MSLRTKEKLAMMVTVLSILVIVGSVSFAYFTAVGETKPQDASLSSGTMSMTFADNDSQGINATLSFDESVTKKFTLTNTGTVEATGAIYWTDLLNTYTKGSLTYTLSYSETENGTYTEIVKKKNVPVSTTSSRKVLATDLTVPVGKTYYYNLEITLNYLDDVNQDADIGASFNTTFEVVDMASVSPSAMTLEKLNLSSKGVISDFDTPATTEEESGIYQMEDDYGMSYYYRGLGTNNYVQFAGFYWRIIRINGDGSLRIIYDGTSAHANGEYSADRYISEYYQWNTRYNDAKYVGWMFGGAQGEASTSKTQAQTNQTSSEIKVLVDEWYKTNIVDKGYSEAVSDTLFCNDRSTPGQSVTNIQDDTGLGYGAKPTGYGAYARMRVGYSGNAGATPSFKCPQKNDAFTVSDTSKGNGALTYPVGLITADEVVTAGSGKYSTGSSYYLNRSWRNYWTLSPYCNNNGGSSRIFIVYSGGSLNYNDATTSSGIVPVINLSAEYIDNLVGSGTAEDPYRVSVSTEE